MADIPGDDSTTETISVGDSVIGALEVSGDRDWFRIELTEGQAVTISLEGITLEDPYLRIRDSAGNIVYENDDISPGTNRDSIVSFSATYTGTYYIDVGAWNDGYAGDYQLSVSIYDPPPLGTYDEIADQLVSGYWSGYSHSFDTAGGSITVNLTALTADGQALAREALALWSDIIGVDFPEGSRMAGLLGAIYDYRLERSGQVVKLPTERLYAVDGTPREEFVPKPASCE